MTAGPLSAPAARTWPRAVGAVAPPVTVAGIVAISFALRAVLAGRTASPWIVPDELIYAELAKSLAWLGELSIRGVPTLGYGVGYPALLAPAYALAGDPVQGYALAKLVNALLMSLAAVPAYLIARRVLGSWLSVVAAGLAVAIPSLAYTGVIMTENAFYPAFLVAVLTMLRALERPSAGRQVAVLVAVAAAASVRAQGLVLLPAFLAAVVTMAGLDARAGRGALLGRLGAFRLTWLIVASAGGAFAGVQVLRGGSVSAPLGVYAVVVDHVSLGGLLEWLLYHVGELDLYLGIVPFAAFACLLAGALHRRAEGRELRVFLVVSTCVTVAMLVVVAAFASKPYAGAPGFEASPSRLRERNLFAVAPLFLIALVYWLRAGMPRPRRLRIGVAAAAAVLPMTVPYASSLPHASFQALAVAPWAAFGPEGATIGASLFAVAGAAVFALAPVRWAPFVAAFVAANFAVVSFVAVEASHVLSQETRARALGGARADWIDRAAGGGPVVAIWAADGRWSETERHRALRSMWIGEFFNRGVGEVRHLVDEMPYGLPSTAVVVGDDGVLVGEPAGDPLTAQHVVVPCSLAVRGTRLDAAAGLALYRVDGAVRVRQEGSGACP